MKTDPVKRRKRTPPSEWFLILFGLALAGVIALLFAPFYLLVPPWRPVIREFFAPLKRFLPGGPGSEEPDNFLE